LAAKLAHIPPFLLLGISLIIGGSLSLRHYRQWNFNPRLILIGVGGIFGYHFLLFMALRMAPPVSANLLNYLWPIFILLFTPLVFPEIKVRKRHLIGTGIAFAGAGVILLESGLSLSLDHAWGYVLAIFAALTWAIYSLLSKKVSAFSSATIGLFCLISGVMALIAHGVVETAMGLTFTDIWQTLLLGLGPMGIAFYCWDAAVKKGDPRIIAVLSYFTPLLSTLLLILFSDQAFSKTIFYAMALISGGAIVASLPVSVPEG